MGSTRMDGPVLVTSLATQASGAGGITAYPMISCFGAKAVTFFVRTAAGVPNLASSTIDVDPGGGMANITGVASDTQGFAYTIINGSVFVVAGMNTALYAKTDLRLPYDRIGLRGQLAASATGVSCYAVVQWD